jgi:hypothetical protein
VQGSCHVARRDRTLRRDAPAVLNIIGEHPLVKGPHGRLKSRIGTLFPGTGALVTLPGIHATQRRAYLDLLNRTRLESSQEPLSREQEAAVWDRAVDLIMEDDAILIRPNPDQMRLAFLADELLQDLVPKHKIRFLHVLNKKVRAAIKRRGECWRIHPLPKSNEEMERMIAASRIGIGGREIYYYNKSSGTRLLTFYGFTQLGAMNDDDLRAHLLEIREFSARVSVQGNPEVDFFMTKQSFSKTSFADYDFRALDPDQLWTAYRKLNRDFRAAVPPEYRWDDLRNVAWRNRMFASLIGEEGEAVSEEMLLGLSPEFFMRIQWLPGGRIEEGELIYDSIFEQTEGTQDPELQRLRDENSRGFIYNLVREFDDVEYVNVGWVVESLALRPASDGRRGVYIAEFKRRGSDQETVSIIRMQKWGVREHLNDGLTLAHATYLSDAYTEYVLDRWTACRHLGMNLPTRATARKISEKYTGTNWDFLGVEILSTYFERDYIRGIATDKLPRHRLQNRDFALALARLLGDAAATNMIVGRCSPGRDVLFDDGDEVLLEDESGMPARIVVADQTGNFVDYEGDLADSAPAYAEPINRRAEHLPDAAEFTRVYLDAFVERFEATQANYRERRKAFDSLFRHRPWDENGSIAFRWQKVLCRLDRADPKALRQIIRDHVKGI